LTPDMIVASKLLLTCYDLRSLLIYINSQLIYTMLIQCICI